MKDHVLIEGLSVDTVIGVYDWEQKITQTLIIDLDMAWDNQPAAVNDDINKALDYAQVSEAVVQLVTARPRQLIEQVAEEVASMIVHDFKVSELSVKVAKPGAVRNATAVAVKICRTQSTVIGEHAWR